MYQIILYTSCSWSYQPVGSFRHTTNPLNLPVTRFCSPIRFGPVRRPLALEHDAQVLEGRSEPDGLPLREYEGGGRRPVTPREHHRLSTARRIPGLRTASATVSRAAFARFCIAPTESPSATSSVSSSAYPIAVVATRRQR